jgi:hypothetical protein
MHVGMHMYAQELNMLLTVLISRVRCSDFHEALGVWWSPLCCYQQSLF